MTAQDCQRKDEAWSGERIGPGALASVPVPGMSQKGLLCHHLLSCGARFEPTTLETPAPGSSSCGTSQG